MLHTQDSNVLVYNVTHKLIMVVFTLKTYVHKCTINNY